MSDAPAIQPPDEQSPPATAQCAKCGVTSTLPELFEYGTIDSRRSGLLCPQCRLDVEEFYARCFFTAMCLVVLLGALLMSRGLAPVGVIMVSFAVGFFFTVVLTPLHELGHALTAVALGLRVYSIVIGWFGKPLVSFNLGRCAIEVTRVPLGGMVFVAHPSSRYIRTKEMLVVAAGPLVNGALVLIVWEAVGRNRAPEWMPGWLAWVVIVLGLASAYSLVLSLWPRRYRSAFGDAPSDGLALLTIPFATKDQIDEYHLAYYYLECSMRLRERDHAGVEDCIREGLERFPDHPALKSFQAMLFLDQDRCDEASRVFEALRQQPEITPDVDAVLVNNIAWADLISWNPEKLKRADDYSRQALEALPWHPPFNGTRGAVLVALGEVESGMPLLERAFAGNRDRNDKAFNAAFLALGNAQLGEFDDARRRLREAERLDPRCRILERVRRKIDSQASHGRGPSSPQGRFNS